MLKEKARTDLDIVEDELKRLIKKHPNAATLSKQRGNVMHRNFFADKLRENIPDVDEADINTAIIARFED